MPGGAADTQGYFREGDTIASVDGIPLRGRLLQDVMDRSKNSYSFDVWRLTPVRLRIYASRLRRGPPWLLSPLRGLPQSQPVPVSPELAAPVDSHPVAGRAWPQVEPEPVAPKAVNPVRRAFSFDRKKR